jgi:hypothetical protein
MLRFCHFQLVNNARIQQTGLLSIGSKACGGPTGFVAYSLNTTEFFITKKFKRKGYFKPNFQQERVVVTISN